MNAMRILVVSHMFPSSLAPDDVFIYNQVKALMDQGVEVRVLQPVPWAPGCLRWKEKWRRYHAIARETSWNGMEIQRVSYPHPPTEVLQPFASALLIAPLLLALRSVRRTFDFQVIHAHTLTPDGFASVVAGHVLKKPVVVSARGSDVHTYPHRSALARKAARFVLARGDRILAVSRELASQIAELAPRPAAVEVVCNGVDAALFSPCADKIQARSSLGIPRDALVVLAAGSLIREKGLSELIQAFERVGRERPEVRLVVVGGGPMRTELEALGRRLGGGGRVLLPGVVPNGRVADYMRAADVLLHPSHAEGLPNVVLEAMASELPVIATTVGGIPEVVVHGGTGLLCEAKDSKALEAHLRAVLDDPEMARAMGRAGRNRVLARHSWAGNVREHIRIYESLLDKPVCIPASAGCPERTA
jgi:glycosyltransferase involved in cell wall biosynthesis